MHKQNVNHNSKFITILAAFAISILPNLSFGKSRNSCSITYSDYLANSKLSFKEFDQEGTLPSTSRSLSERECYKEAVLSAQNYLSSNPSITTHQIQIISWHMAQDTAFMGDEKSAAPLMLSALGGTNEPVQPDGFDWNSYVVGSWAFLMKNKDLLVSSRNVLYSKGGARNVMNAKVLDSFINCFNRPYGVAYTNKDCKTVSK